MYGEYAVNENGEVIDSSPFYGDTVEDWEGATIKDQNTYHNM